MSEIHGSIDAKGKRFAIVVSRWNELVTKELLDGALSELKRLGDPEVEVVHVPGTWEMPPVVSKLLNRPPDRRPHGIIALGCILQGQTPHAKLLGSDVGGALMSLQTQYQTAVSWGVLTPDTQDQALDRAGMKYGNKGREAAQAAVETASILERL